MGDLKRPHSPPPPAFSDPVELANAVILTLLAPSEPTAVATAYANAKNGALEVQAYAKIAGRDWTYYVKTLTVTLGRHTDVPGEHSPETVHIDLGPAKVVSRQHASIAYNGALRCWELRVVGRNGARVDGVRVPVGGSSAAPLHSGAILDVGGTQMMFILPDTPPAIAPRMFAACMDRYSPDKRPRAAPGATFLTFARGPQAASPSAVSAVLLQHNLDQDLLREDAKDIKPPYLYATMITQAILLNPDGVMLLAEIYAWIASRYAYYKYSKTGWQNLIRHNLSLNKAFEKVPRRPNEPGKGMKWQISDAYRHDFLQKVQAGTLLKSRRGSSVSRTLQIHLATHQGLPETKSFARPEQQDVFTQSPQDQTPFSQNPYGNGYAYGQNGFQRPYQGIQGHQGFQNSQGLQNQQGIQTHQGLQNQQGIQTHQGLQNHQGLQGLQGLQSNQGLQNYQGIRGPQGPQGHPGNQGPHIQGMGQDVRHQGLGQALHQGNPQQSASPTQDKSQDPSQNPTMQLRPPSNKRMELASPLRHTSADALHPQMTSFPAQNGAPGINLFKMAPTQVKQEHSPTENGRASFGNTNESIMQNSTAPTTSNTSELALFTSPKKVVPLEAFTPDRGSKSAGIGKSGNVNQSSPAFWNFVQFSTPNGQTPGRKDSTGSNDQESPSLNRGAIDRAGSVCDDSPPQ